jgi:hypothetical protein
MNMSLNLSEIAKADEASKGSGQPRQIILAGTVRKRGDGCLVVPGAVLTEVWRQLTVIAESSLHRGVDAIDAISTFSFNAH